MTGCIGDYDVFCSFWFCCLYYITILRFWPVSWWPLHLETTGHSFSVAISKQAVQLYLTLMTNQVSFNWPVGMRPQYILLHCPVLSILIINLTVTYYLLQFLKEQIRKGSSWGRRARKCCGENENGAMRGSCVIAGGGDWAILLCTMCPVHSLRMMTGHDQWACAIEDKWWEMNNWG